eukprot:366283-Chlamydomonas_euryale.AAC.1
MRQVVQLNTTGLVELARVLAQRVKVTNDGVRLRCMMYRVWGVETRASNPDGGMRGFRSRSDQEQCRRPPQQQQEQHARLADVFLTISKPFKKLSRVLGWMLDKRQRRESGPQSREEKLLGTCG